MDKIIRIDILQGDWVKTVHKYMNMLGYGTKLDVNSGRLHVFNESEYETVYSIIPNGFYPLSARRPPPLRWGMNCVPNLTKLLDNGRTI